ncbi:MAG: hypothetical protein IVW57_06565 [Ktedonobacterales bacterium]|nr:hypothetical protein [Ktedonobacterales bacterium]
MGTPTVPSVAPAVNGVAPAPVLPARRWFAAVFTFVALLVTVGALALATYAPQTLPARADVAPASWSRVYDADLRTADNAWDVTAGCAFSHGGLLAGDGASCVFTPSMAQDLVSGGFLLDLTLAPIVDVPGTLRPRIQVGGGVIITLNTDGQYSLCSTVSCATTEALRIQGTTINWHGDDFVANTVSVGYDASTTRLTLSINGQAVASANTPLDPRSSLAVGALDGAQALYTHATLYSASSTGL